MTYFHQYKIPEIQFFQFKSNRSSNGMFSVKVLPSHWRILFFILEIGFLLVPTLEAAKAWSVTKVKAQDTDKLTISCPTGFHIVITYGEYGNKDSNCSDVFNQYNLARKCNYKQVCVFLQVNDGMKTSCPQGTKQYLNLHYKCMSGQSMLQFTQLTRKDKVHTLTCPLNARIYIVNATYSDNKNTCVIDAKEDVKFSCWEHECTYHNIIRSIKDICPKLKKKLLIMYICKVEEELQTFVVEGRPKLIECPHNYRLDILRANYSDPLNECKPNAVDTHIKKRCSSKQRCTIERTIFSQFPSGCGTDLTELLVAYRCVQLEETRTFTVFENGLVDISCFHYHKIKIIHASFGKRKKGCGSETAMERLKKECEGKTRCCGTANTKLLGNSTCPENDSQKLRVTYECVRIDAENIFEKQKEDDECHKIRFKVSSSFGEITSETVQKMDENLILMIGDSLPRLKQMSLETYDGIVEYMKDIPSLEVISNSTKKRTGSYVSSSDGLTDLISRTKSKYQAITWYNNFIKNKQIINDAHIDIEFLAEVMTETGVYVKSFESFFFDKVKEVIQEVDISILRFPDIENPYFLVYHIKIMAWRVSERLLMYEQTAGGLQGLFQSIKFRPNTKYLSSLEPDIIKSAKEEAEKIFD